MEKIIEKILTFIIFILSIIALVKVITMKPKTIIQPVIDNSKCYTVEYKEETYKLCGEEFILQDEK